MRQRLYARGYTWYLRGSVSFLGLFVLAVIGVTPHPMEYDGSLVVGTFCWGFIAVIVVIMAVKVLRFSSVWLDDGSIEIRRGGTVVRVPLTDLTNVDFVRSRPDYIRLRFKHRPPVSFIPIDGVRTRNQLFELKPK